MSIERLTEILRESQNIVFFGGAGISTSSGIPDFRSSNGLYSKKLNRNFTPPHFSHFGIPSDCNT